MSQLCPSAEKCPIFNGMLKDKVVATKMYQTQYCEAGEEGRNKCRRWQSKERFGKVPPNLLPNSFKSLDDIARDNNWS
jgi:hypothetical protein